MENQTQWLETILDFEFKAKRVAKITKIELEPVVNKGDNYASEMTRIKMEVILGSGKKTKKSLIMKGMPDTELRAKHLKQWGVFKKEIKMYRDVLPLMEDLLLEVGDRSEPMWGECVNFRPYDRLIFEDLQESGYRMADKKLGLDFAHTALTLRSLGKFHALSAVMREQGLLDPSDFKETVFSNNPDMIQQFHDGTFSILADVIESTWEPEYKSYAGNVRALIGNTMDRTIKLYKTDESEFNVIIHGDCWLNNMLFKYVGDTKVPASVRFVDFQMSYMNIPGIELQYFFSTSVRNEVKEKNMEELLKIYHESLLFWLKRLGYTSENVPTMDDVNKWLEKTAFFGIIIASTALTFMLTDPDDAPDIEEMIKELEKSQKVVMNVRPFMGKVFTERMKYILKKNIEKGVI